MNLGRWLNHDVVIGRMTLLWFAWIALNSWLSRVTGPGWTGLLFLLMIALTLIAWAWRRDNPQVSPARTENVEEPK